MSNKKDKKEKGFTEEKEQDEKDEVKIPSDISNTSKEDKKSDKATKKKSKDKDDSDKVEVESDVLKKLLDRVENLEEDNSILKEAANKKRLENVQSRRSEGELVKAARLSFLNDSAVIGWKKLEDEVYFDQDGRLHESQTMTIFLKSSPDSVVETLEIDYKKFDENIEKREGEVISQSQDKKGNTTYTIQFSDGQEYEVDIKFIN